MSGIHLKDLSKVYKEQIVEKKDDSYLETDMKKRQKNNEKARKDMKKMGSMSNPHFGDGPTGSMSSEEVEVEEGMHRDAKTGEVVDKAEVGKTYYPNMPKKKTSVALRKEKMKEGLDPVGKEDGDVNNDGKKDSTDSYLMKRRKAIGKAIKKKMSEGVRDMDPEKGTAERKARLEKKRGMKMSDHPQYKKNPDEERMQVFQKLQKNVDQKKKMNEENISNWRQDLSEIMSDDIDSNPVKEKKISNKIKINPKLGEAVEEIGGKIIEMVELVDEEASMSPQELQLQKKKAMLDKMIAQKRQQGLNKVKKSEPPTKAMGEEMDCAHNPQGKDCPVHGKKECPSIVKSEMGEGVLDAALETDKKMGELHKKVDNDVKRMKDGKKFKEELSVDQQMKISRDYNRKSPEEKRAANSKLLGAIKKVKREKDTRTDAQKMTDATGPRPGSRYRGD